jgi:hypothetical protein
VKVTRPFARHPIQAAEGEAEHLREVAAEGQSAATPVIVVAALLVSLILIVAAVIALAFVVFHFS